MSRPDAISFLLAVVLHGVVLFALPGTESKRFALNPARPDYLEVTLAETAPVIEAKPLPMLPPPVETPPRPEAQPPKHLPLPPKEEAKPSDPPTTLEPVAQVLVPEPPPALPPIVPKPFIEAPPSPAIKVPDLPRAPTPAQVAVVTPHQDQVEQRTRESAPAFGTETKVLPTTPTGDSYQTINQPYYLKRVETEYPPQARRLRQQGVVVLTLYINAVGTLDQIEVKQSSGYPLLDQAAIAAEKKSRFRPAYAGNKPVPSKAEVPYRFKLD